MATAKAESEVEKFMKFIAPVTLETASAMELKAIIWALSS
jgi:hypothetical protein